MAGIISGAMAPPPKPTEDPAALIGPTQTTAANNSTTNPSPTVAPTTTPNAYTPAQAADPAKWNVDSNQTVSGQITQLIDQNSPLMEQARTNAKQAANQRGLVNSAMAVSAGESAAYQAALPIAQQDAETNARASSYNTEATNQNSQFNTTAQNAALSQGSQQQSQADLQKELQQADLRFQQIQLDNQTLLQTNAQAADLMNQATGVLNNILMNPKMSAEAKTRASAQIYANLQAQLRLIGATSGLDLGSLLSDNPYGPTDTSASFDAEQQAEEERQYRQRNMTNEERRAANR